MQIPTTVDTYLRHVATEGQKTFLAPGLTLSGAPYALAGEHEVRINEEPTTNPWTYDSGTGIITFTNGLSADDVVEIWRRTEVDESLVTFPAATSWTPKHNNKSMTQLLMLIQELWGGLQELETQVMAYVGKALEALCSSGGLTGITWSTTVSNGATTLTTPYQFTKGLLIVGGIFYNLSNPAHATLTNPGGGNTVINFVSPVVGTHEAILLIF